MTEDTLELLHAGGLLSEEEADTALRAQQTLGGTLLRVLERTAADTHDLWRRLARLHGRPVYTRLNDIETVEEAIHRPGGGVEPMLPRPLALDTLTLAQRREGETLRLLSPNPFLDLSDSRLQERAHAISLTGGGDLACSVLPPDLYRRCLRLTYPEALAGPLSLADRLAVTGLIPGAEMRPYQGREAGLLGDGLISEDDYAAALADHLNLPLYRHAPVTLEEHLLPEEAIRRHDLYPLRLDREQGTLVVLTATAPDDLLGLHLRRLSGWPVAYEITTRTVIRSLIQKRGRSHAHH